MCPTIPGKSTLYISADVVHGTSGEEQMLRPYSSTVPLFSLYKTRMDPAHRGPAALYPAPSWPLHSPAAELHACCPAQEFARQLDQRRLPAPPRFLRQPASRRPPSTHLHPHALHAAAPACAVLCRLPSSFSSHAGGGRRSLPAVARPRGVVSAAPLRTRAGTRCRRGLESPLYAHF